MNEVRLIDAEALRNEVDTWGCNDFDKYDFLEAIDKAPTVDAIPNAEGYEMYNKGYVQGYERGKAEARPQGEWIDRTEDKGYVECPFCHKQISGGDLNFCVKCGAEMKGGAE